MDDRAWYEYGVRRVFQEVEPSPRAKFRDYRRRCVVVYFSCSTSQTGECQAVRLGGAVLRMGFFGANFRTAQIQTATSSSGPWTTIANVDLSVDSPGSPGNVSGHRVAAPPRPPTPGRTTSQNVRLLAVLFHYMTGSCATILRNTGGCGRTGNTTKRAFG